MQVSNREQAEKTAEDSLTFSKHRHKVDISQKPQVDKYYFLYQISSNFFILYKLSLYLK